MEDRQLLFGPKNEKDLKRQYPELGKEPEFASLTVGEMLFVWWFSNPTSPLVADDNLDDKMRAVKAYDQSFKNSKNHDRKEDYFSLNFPDKIRLAIDRMRRFNPTVRIRAKFMVETILKKYEELVDVNLEDFEEIDEESGTKKTNWTGRNQYVNSTKNIAEALPALIRQVEEGFGVADAKNVESGEKAITRYHATHIDS